MPQMRDKILRVLVMFPRSEKVGREVLQGNGCDLDEKDCLGPGWFCLHEQEPVIHHRNVLNLNPLKTLYINNIKVSQSFELNHCFFVLTKFVKATAAVPFLTLPGHFSLGEGF